MARNIWLVCYDICDDKRRQKVFRALEGFGDRLQHSVWRCVLDRRGRIELEAALAEAIHHREDQILFANLGPEQGRGKQALDSLGQDYQPPQDTIMIF